MALVRVYEQLLNNCGFRDALSQRLITSIDEEEKIRRHHYQLLRNVNGGSLRTRGVCGINSHRLPFECDSSRIIFEAQKILSSIHPEMDEIVVLIK